MTDKPKAPAREWWIWDGTAYDDNPDTKYSHHVVEMSALTEAKESLAKVISAYESLSAHSQGWELKCVDARTALTEAREEIESLKAQLTCANTSATCEESDPVFETCVALEAALKQAREEIARLKREVEAERKEVAVLQAEVARLEEKCNALQLIGMHLEKEFDAKNGPK